MRKIFNLRKLREEKSYTQKALADILDVSQTDISRYESNPDIIPFRIILRIAALFGFSSLDDFKNEIQTVPPIFMADVFEPLRCKRKLYIETLLKNEAFANDINTYLNLFILERPIYQYIHKPLVYISCKNVELCRNFASALTGVDLSSVPFSIPLFLASKEECILDFPNLAGFTESYPWLKDQIWYFKKTNVSALFDISISKCIAYSCPLPLNFPNDFGGGYADFFLNVKDKKDAATAVCYADCDLLKNVNLVIMPAFDENLSIAMSDTCDIALNIEEVGSSTQSNISGTIETKNSESKFPFNYSFADGTCNSVFEKNFSESISFEIEHILESFPSELNSYFKVLEEVFSKIEHTEIYSDEDKLKLLKSQNDLRDFINISLATEIKLSKSDFDTMYSEETNALQIESMISSLGCDNFPANVEQFEEAKQKILENFSEKFVNILANHLESFFDTVCKKIKAYKDEPKIYEYYEDFLYGMELGRRHAEAESKSKKIDSGFDIMMKQMPHFYREMESAFRSFEKMWDEKFYIQNIFDEALKNVVTFSRGLTASKARKISKALQNFQVFIEFTNTIDRYWKSVEMLCEAIFFGTVNKAAINTLPQTLEDIKLNEKINKTLLEIVREFLSFQD